MRNLAKIQMSPKHVLPPLKNTLQIQLKWALYNGAWKSQIAELFNNTRMTKTAELFFFFFFAKL